jgi:putative hydrolase of the HAD superfamily
MLEHFPIRAITFDVGGTLIHPWPSVGHVYAEVAAAHGVHVAPELLNRRFPAAWKSLSNFRHTRDDWARLVDLTFDGLAPSPPSDSFFPELYDRFRDAAVWRIFPDARPALEALANGDLKLAILSNWDERLRPLLRDLDLERYFDEMIISCEAGVPKPAPEIFRQAARQLGLAPDRILHVGDDSAADLKGAQVAGFRAVLLKRGKEGMVAGRVSRPASVSGSLESEADQLTATVLISDLSELAALVSG